MICALVSEGNYRAIVQATSPETVVMTQRRRAEEEEEEEDHDDHAKHVKSNDNQSPMAGSVAIHLNADFAGAQELLRVARGRVRSRV